MSDALSEQVALHAKAIAAIERHKGCSYQFRVLIDDRAYYVPCDAHDDEGRCTGRVTKP